MDADVLYDPRIMTILTKDDHADRLLIDRGFEPGDGAGFGEGGPERRVEPRQGIGQGVDPGREVDPGLRRRRKGGPGGTEVAAMTGEARSRLVTPGHVAVRHGLALLPARDALVGWPHRSLPRPRPSCHLEDRRCTFERFSAYRMTCGCGRFSASSCGPGLRRRSETAQEGPPVRDRLPRRAGGIPVPPRRSGRKDGSMSPFWRVATRTFKPARRSAKSWGSIRTGTDFCRCAAVRGDVRSRKSTGSTTACA